jgi:hypothetical protein
MSTKTDRQQLIERIQVLTRQYCQLAETIEETAGDRFVPWEFLERAKDTLTETLELIETFLEEGDEDANMDHKVDEFEAVLAAMEKKYVP